MPVLSAERSHVNGGTERRRHVRVGVATTVTYLVEGATAQNVGTSDDVGGGGMRLATREPLAVGTMLLLRFLMPSSEREVMARGRIVMSFYEAASERFKHGIAFTQFEPDGRDTILRYVASELQRNALSFKQASGE